MEVLVQHTPDTVLSKSKYTFYFLGYELFKADAACNTYALYGGVYFNTITSNEGCGQKARDFGAYLFVSCAGSRLICHVYTKTRSIDTCTTHDNFNNCHIYRVQHNASKTLYHFQPSNIQIQFSWFRLGAVSSYHKIRKQVSSNCLQYLPQ